MFFTLPSYLNLHGTKGHLSVDGWLMPQFAVVSRIHLQQCIHPAFFQLKFSAAFCASPFPSPMPNSTWLLWAWFYSPVFHLLFFPVTTIHSLIRLSIKNSMFKFRTMSMLRC